MILLDLFIGFLAVGFFSFGGAYGSIPLIREIVLSYGWLDEEKLTYMIAVSESTPGPIMVNLATYVGSSQAGLPGALVSTFAVVFPAFAIVIAIMLLSRKIPKSNVVRAILDGVKPCVVGIILATGLYMAFINCFGSFTTVSVDITAIILFAVLSGIYFGSRKWIKNGISPIVLIGVSAVFGILAYGYR